MNRSGKASSRPRRLAAERRVVTILFTDVKGSTAMAESLDPEEWAEIMNEAFDYLTQPVIRYGGTVARLMGDAALAFFGAPTAHEDDPLRAVLAGLDIIEGLQPFRERLGVEYGLDFNVRVGINTGIAVVGEMGSALAGEYTAMGDAVNLAARMEQSAEPGTIKITDETYHFVAPWIEVDPLGEMEIKGRSELIPVYRVLGRKKIPSRARGIAGIRSSLVGRGAEISRMREMIRELFSGQGSILTLIGDAGLGKSRLVEELRSELENAYPGEYEWVDARGISYEMSRPYGMYVQALRQICQITDDQPLEEIQVRVRESFAGLSSEKQADIADIVEILLAADQGAESQEAAVQGEAIKRKIFSSMLELWTAKAGQQPLILALDDLHWADQASVELTRHLFQLVENTPILFLCALRPHRESPAWQLRDTSANYGPAAREIFLSPLAKEDSNQLIDNILQISELPDELRRSILDKSEGNPFFLEEVIRTLIDNGVIQQGENGFQWQLAREYEEVDIPDNLHTLLLARIDRLDSDARRTLQIASVIGRVFPLQVIEEVGNEVPEIEEQLKVLQLVGLIQVESQSPELEYAFRHELTREAAYQSILKRQRRLFHRQVGAAIEKLYAGNLAEHAYRLAYHYNSARDFKGALKYYQIAGAQSMKLFANREASQYFQQAIRLALMLNVTNIQLVQLFIQRGRALELINDFDEALENYEELEELALTRRDRSLELAALVPQTTIYSTPNVKFDPHTGAQLSRRALNLAIELRDYEAEAKALWSLMLIQTFTRNDLDQAISYGEQGLRIAREHDLREVKAYIQHDLARPYMRMGRLKDAWKAYRSSQVYWREVENLPMLADSLASLAESYYNAGEFDQALSYAQEGKQISEDTSNVWGKAYNNFVFGPILMERGRIDESLAALDETLALSSESNFAAGVVATQMIQSWLYAMLGDLGRARSYESLIKKFVEQYESFNPLYQVNLAQNEYYAGNYEQASQIFDQLGTEYSTYSELIFHPYIYTLHIEIHLANQEYETALQIADSYLNTLEKQQVQVLVPDMLNQKARAYIGLDQNKAAYETLVRGRNVAEKQISRRSLWAILVDLAEIEPDPKAAEQLRNEARSIVNFIVDHVSDPELRGKFRNLERVRKLD